MNSITVIREIPHCLPHKCSPVEFVPRSWVLEHCHHVQEVPGGLGAHWFSNETRTSQAEGNVPVKSKGFAASVPVLQLGLFGRYCSLHSGAASQDPLSLTAPSPQPTAPPLFLGKFLSPFLLNALRVTLAALPLQVS